MDVDRYYTKSANLRCIVEGNPDKEPLKRLFVLVIFQRSCLILRTALSRVAFIRSLGLYSSTVKARLQPVVQFPHRRISCQTTF